jgi:uncharacterized protein YoaH (UPF0181 family)
MPSKPDPAAVEEAREALAAYAASGVEALAHVAAALRDHPADRGLQAVLARTMLDLERHLRLLEALDQRFPATPPRP